MRSVKHKKGFFLLVIVSLFLPISAYASENQTGDIGIGFAGNQPAPKEVPFLPEENVLPLTSGYKSYPTRYGTLPKTGMIHTNWANRLGVLCLAVCFWLFLFFRIKDDEDSKEGGNRKETN